MATPRKRGERWQVQVRRKGSPSLTRSFLPRSDAEAWAREQELEADRRGIHTAHKGFCGVTVAGLVACSGWRRYRRAGAAISSRFRRKVVAVPAVE